MQVKGVKGGRSYKPYAFTEQGIYMLMTVLFCKRGQKCRNFVKFRDLPPFSLKNL
jgi:hypothetical protein